MARTTAAAVKAVLGKDYDTDESPDLAPYIATANAIVARVATCATAKKWSLSTAELELIERWLAAWAYTKSDPVYQSDGGATFVRGKVEPEPYKDMALSLDSSGCLSAILNRKRVTVDWLGKAPLEQSDAQTRGW